MKRTLAKVYVKKIKRARTILAKVTFAKYTGVPYDVRVKNLESGMTEW